MWLGYAIKVFKDPWLMEVNRFILKHKYGTNMDNHFMVSNLMIPRQGLSNFDLIWTLFTTKTTATIMWL